MKKLVYHLTGVRPILFHNQRLANPLNPFAKALKKISGKKAKTDADHMEMAKIEFHGGLYTDDEGHPIMPFDGIEAIVRDGAKKTKEGKVVQSGVFCTKDARLEYDGPKTPDELWEEGGEEITPYAYQTMVKVGQSKICRTRPQFKDWSATIELSYNPDVCDDEQITKWLEVAGEQCGAYDYRPRFGRFTVEKVE